MRCVFKWEKEKIRGIFAAFLIALCILAVISLCFAPVGHYYAAKAHMRCGEYTDAYFHLLKCRDFKDSQRLLKDFVLEYECAVTRESVYDETGNMTWQQETKVIYSYDKTGHLTLTQYYNAQGQPSTKIIKEYTADGDLLRDITYTAGGTPSSTLEYTYTYNPAGRRIKTTVYRDSKVRNTYTYTYNSDGNISIQTTYSAAGQIAGQYFYTYDSAGNLTGYKDTDKNGKLTGRFSYEYDDNGNKVWQSEFHPLTGERRSQAWHYDDDGNLTEAFTYFADGMRITHYASNGEVSQWINYDNENQLVSKTVFTLDQEGNQTHLTTYGKDGSIRSRRTNAYLYDIYAVVLKKTRFNSDGTPASILTRSPDHKTLQNTNCGYQRSSDGTYYLNVTVDTICSQPVAFYQPKK